MHTLSTASLSEYKYSSLTSATSVRYVKLLPGLGDDIIDCDIFEASTNDAVPYTALSYAWGPISNSISIRCSGTRYLTVRSNLYQALWHIRHPVESRIMWVDAICINQGDVSERNHQVAQMTQVYSQAEKLFIWLGRESDEKAVNLIVSLSKMSKKHRRQPGGVNVQPHLNQQDWKTLRVYLDATWFERVWVIQELVLGLQLQGPFATEVLCGPHSVTWKELSRCLRYIDEQYATLVAGTIDASDAERVRRHITKFRHLQDMTDSRPKHSQTEYDWTRWLLKTLPDLRSKKCTDPRDRIFSLYGLCCAVPQPLPDYTLTTSEVYLRFTVDAIRTTRSLNILSEIEARSNSSEMHLPSWVPDWNVIIGRYSFRRKNFLNTCGLPSIPDNLRVADISTLPNSNILHLAGIIFDEIVYVGDSFGSLEMTNLNEDREWLQAVWYSLLCWRYTNDGDHTGMGRRREPSNSVIGDGANRPEHSRTELTMYDPYKSMKTGFWKGRGARYSDPAFARFIYTIIANTTVRGLDELIKDGEKNFFGLLNHSDQTSATALPLLSRKDVKKLQKAQQDSKIDAIHRSRRREDVKKSEDETASHSNPAMVFEDAPQSRRAKISIMTEYLSCLKKPAYGRRVFVTRNGYMGLGVRSTTIGDQVAVLSTYGNIGRTPYCIRPNGMKYEFVGEAYVHELNFDDGVALHWEKIDLV